MSRPWGAALRRASIARVMLLLGATVAILFAGRVLPIDHNLHFRLPKSAESTCRLEFAWQLETDHESLGGVSIPVPNARSRSVDYSFRAPAGLYRLTAVVRRPRRNGFCNSELATHPMRDQRIRLEGGDTEIHLHPADTP